MGSQKRTLNLVTTGARCDSNADARFRFIVENVPEILAQIGTEGAIQYVSPHTERVLGYRNGELEGRNVFDFIHPEDLLRAAREYADTVHNTGERVPSILRLRDSVGNWIPFEIIANNPIGASDGGVILTARDLRFRKDIDEVIRRANADTNEEVSRRTTELAKANAALRIENTARREAESKLQHTISLLNATLDATADGILVVSNEGKVTSCNQKFFEMWKLGCDFAVGKQDKDLLEEVIGQLQNADDFLDRVRALYADHAASSLDVVYFKDGRIFERNSQPQRIGDEIVGRVWSFRDVTRARNLERELRQSQKMEALGRLAGGIAHDFNNLLMLISGYLRQMLENPALAEGHGTCEQIKAAVERAASVTKQLLAFSRKTPDAITVVDLNAIVMNMEQMLRRLLSAQIRLQFTLTSDPQPVYVDVSQVEVLLMNLVINAQDAMPEGGLLSIATSREVISPGDDGDQRGYVVLEITDTGLGMTPEVQARIFEPFFTTKQAGKGTGLGLSTVFGIVERAGGYIHVRSEVNQGTHFRIFLPQAVAAPAATNLPAPSVQAPVGGDETVMLVEDEAGIRAMTRTYLEGLGYTVLEAGDGAEAIKVSLEYSGEIHVVVADIIMPGMRGDVAAEAIRKQRRETKTILMSGYTDQDVVSDFDNVLLKPFDFPELGRRLRAVLDSQKKASAEPSD